MKPASTTAAVSRTTRRVASFITAVCTALLLLPTFAAEAAAQSYVTGSANTEGFSIVGWVKILNNGRVKGNFLIVVHRDEPEFTTAAAVCTYKAFDNVVINDNRATFHSVGSCVSLTTTGGRESFTSDNTFTIVDNGSPGPGVDAIDVNFAGAGGVAIPGSLLVNGNFIVVP